MGAALVTDMQGDKVYTDPTSFDKNTTSKPGTLFMELGAGHPLSEGSRDQGVWFRAESST